MVEIAVVVVLMVFVEVVMVHVVLLLWLIVLQTASRPFTSLFLGREWQIPRFGRVA